MADKTRVLNQNDLSVDNFLRMETTINRQKTTITEQQARIAELEAEIATIRPKSDHVPEKAAVKAG